MLAEIAQRDLQLVQVSMTPAVACDSTIWPAVRCSTNASSTADPNADISLRIDMRLSGMQSDSHANGAGGRERALCGDRRRDGVGGALEGDEEGIALSIDLAAAMGIEDFAQETAVLRAEVAVRRAVLRDSSVEPSISLKRKVTVPLGSSTMRAMVRRLRPKFTTQRQLIEEASAWASVRE